MTGDALKEIVQTAKDGHYQKACGLEFGSAHRGVELSTGITSHPNQYYAESVNGGAESTAANAKKSFPSQRVNAYVALPKKEADPFAEDMDVSGVGDADM